MSITQEQFDKITAAFEKFDQNDEIEVLDLTVGDKEITVSFPRDQVVYAADDFMKYLTELHDLDVSVKRVRSPLITQIPVFGFDFSLEHFLETHKLEYSSGEIVIKLVPNPLLIGIAAVKLGEYSKYSPPCSPYSAIEITYSEPSKRLNEIEEMKLIKSFLFEYSFLSGTAIEFYEIKDHYWDGYSDEDVEPKTVNISTLQGFTEGMELYTKALGTFDPEIRFLFYYKIIEYYSPISAKRQAYESLASKLDFIRISGAQNKDIESILSIAEQFRSAQSDKELAQALLANTVDIVDTFSILPENLQKSISKAANFNRAELSYTTAATTLQKINNILGSVLYSTRNSIVHAKSNYNSDGNECNIGDLPQLNEFLKATTYGIVSWYSRLPNYLKGV